MDHFYITQICINCLRGKKEFRVDLRLYDDNGRLPVGVDAMEQFCFMCQFCWRKTRLDFYKFSHPDMILHLKRLNHQDQLRKQALDQLYIVFNNNKL